MLDANCVTGCCCGRILKKSESSPTLSFKLLSDDELSFLLISVSSTSGSSSELSFDIATPGEFSPRSNLMRRTFYGDIGMSSC